MKKKQAQIKFGESIGIIFIVFIILFAGLLWYNKVNSSQLNSIYLKNQINNAFGKYYYIITLPLIHTSENGIVESYFNSYSLKIFANYSNSTIGRNYLFKDLGYAVITVKIYNKSGLKIINSYLNLTLYNRTPKGPLLEIIPFNTIIPIENQNQEIQIGYLNIKSYVTKN